MLAVVAIALSALASLLDGVDWSDVRDALTRIGWVRLLLAAGITATSYGVLTGYDVIALRVIGPMTSRSGVRGMILFTEMDPPLTL